MVPLPMKQSSTTFAPVARIAFCGNCTGNAGTSGIQRFFSCPIFHTSPMVQSVATRKPGLAIT